MSIRNLRNRLFALLQYVLPHHLLSRTVYYLMRVKTRPVKNITIRGFARLFGIDWDEAESRDPDHYETFNHFFTRELKTGIRPLPADPKMLVSPVDGRVSQAGRIEAGRIFQAKAHWYETRTLLGGDEVLADRFDGGAFCTIYLAPYDYHRIHMPCDGTLGQMIYVPGRLFSVNEGTVDLIPNVFARNERVVNVFQTDYGLMGLVLVGALNVGSMATVWAGDVTPTAKRVPQRWHYDKSNTETVCLNRGDEMGRFNMGSTVIVLFENNNVCWTDVVTPAAAVRMGQGIGGIEENVYPSAIGPPSG